MDKDQWLEVQTFEVKKEGFGGTKPLLIRPEAVVSVEELQGFGKPQATLWRFLNLVDGDCVAVVWTVELVRALGLDGEERQEPPRRYYGDEPLRSQPFREFVAEVNRQRARAGRDPFDMTAAGMAAAIQDHHDNLHRDPSPCPSPASPPSAEPAAQTSSEGRGVGRGTATGAEWCCEPMLSFQSQPCISFSERGVDVYPPAGEAEALPPFEVCPWCEERIGGEGCAAGGAGATSLPSPPPCYELYDEGRGYALMAWPWNEAPPSLRALSPCGGDEELVAYIPKDIVKEDWVESWLRKPPLGWEPRELPLSDGSVAVFFEH